MASGLPGSWAPWRARLPQIAAGTSPHCTSFSVSLSQLPARVSAGPPHSPCNRLPRLLPKVRTWKVRRAVQVAACQPLIRPYIFPFFQQILPLKYCHLLLTAGLVATASISSGYVREFDTTNPNAPIPLAWVKDRTVQIQLSLGNNPVMLQDGF